MFFSQAIAQGLRLALSAFAALLHASAPAAAQAAPLPALDEGLEAFARRLARTQPGCTVVAPMEGNGGRPVLLHVPPGARPDRPWQLVYHFHGTYSEHVEPRRPGLPKRAWVGWNRLEQTTEAAARLQRERPANVALVYPISAGKRAEPEHRGWNNRSYDRMWMKPAEGPAYRDDFDRLHAEVRAALAAECGVPEPATAAPVLAQAHSAGGIALLHIARSGTRSVGEYLFLDAGFDDWVDGVFDVVTQPGSAARLTIVLTEGGIADPIHGRDPWCAWMPTEAAQWAAQGRACAPDQPTETCARRRDAAARWPAKRRFCEHLRDDMRRVPNVTVHRTKVVHGEHPRTFTGGLGLPR